MQKQIINDVGSALLEEAVNQLNNSAVPYTSSMTVNHGTAGNFAFANMTAEHAGFWIKDIVMSLNYAAGTIAAQTTSFEVVGHEYGHFGGHAVTVFFERSDFRAPNTVANDQILSLNALNAGTVVGNFPMYIEAPMQLRFLVNNNEALLDFDTIEVTVWGCPVKDKLIVSPNYTNKLRSFQTL